MSYYSGFAQGLQNAQQQNERDQRLGMDIERQQALAYQQAIDNQRADERMDIARQQAIRQNRDSDFDYQQKTDKAARAKKMQDDIAGAWQNVFGEREVKQEDGSVAKVKGADPTDWKAQAAFYSHVGSIYAQSGAVDPTQMKALVDLRKSMEQEGSADAFRSLAQGDGKKAAALLSGWGLDPASMKIVPKKDPKTGMVTSILSATDKDGNPFERDLTSVMMALGLPMQDVDKPTNDRVKTASDMANDTTRAEASRISANASATSAGASVSNAESLDRLREAQIRSLDGGGSTRSGGGRRADAGTGWGTREDTAFTSTVAREKPQLPEYVRKQAGALGRQGEEDQDGRKIISDYGRQYAANKFIETGKSVLPGEASSEGVRALTRANQWAEKRFDKATFVRNKSTGEIRVAGPGEEGVPAGKLLMSEKPQAFKALRSWGLEQARAAANAAPRSDEDQ